MRLHGQSALSGSAVCSIQMKVAGCATHEEAPQSKEDSSRVSTASDLSEVANIFTVSSEDSESESDSLAPLEPAGQPVTLLGRPLAVLVGLSRPLQIRVCSWNLYGNQIAEADDINRWLQSGAVSDIFVVGVQELIELKPANVVSREHGDPQRLAAIERRVGSALGGSTGKFVRVCIFGLAGLAILVYVHEALAPYVRQLCCDRVKTGFGGFAANKGGVCVRFAVGEISTCFMNVHLPSGTGASAKRDWHLQKVMSQALQRTPVCGGSLWPSPLAGVAPHNFTVIFGDFNSRLELEGNMKLKAARPSPALLDYDELLQGRFPSIGEFREGLVKFPPTFKYIPGTDEFCPGRNPAWCDRVVFKADRGAKAELLEYSSLHELRHTSDHRPVAAQFRVSPLLDTNVTL